ncbi:mitochondrial inner membrane protein COX18, partial [Biomphalaria pfeifferi]
MKNKNNLTLLKMSFRCAQLNCKNINKLFARHKYTMFSCVWKRSTHQCILNQFFSLNNNASFSSRAHCSKIDKSVLNSSTYLNLKKHFTHPVSNVRRQFSTSFSHCVEIPQDIATHVFKPNLSNQLIFQDFPTIQAADYMLKNLHDVTGLPWWLTIISSAFLLRVVLMIPVTLLTQHNNSRLQRLAPEIKEKSIALKSEVKKAVIQFGWDQNRAKKEYYNKLSILLRELYTRDNCHPMKNVVTFWIQIPVFISLSYALRNMVVRTNNDLNSENHEVLNSLTNEGVAWFPDLVATDATWILPVLVGLVTLINIEIAYLNLPDVTTYRKWLTVTLRGLSLIIIPISSTVPSAVVLYWASSGALAVAQNLLFDLSPFRRLCRLPVSAFE